MDPAADPPPEPDTTPEKEAEAARVALAAGDLRAAAAHVGLALTHDMERPEWLALLDAIVAKGEADPERIAPLGPRPFFATVAVRAYVFAKAGELTAAIALLLRTFAAEPAVPFLRWALRWLAAPGAAVTVDTEEVTIACIAVVQRYPGDNLDEGQRAALGEVLRVTEALGEGTAGLSWITSMMLRKVGRVDEAVVAAERAFLLDPSFSTAIALAYAKRQAGDIAGARAGFEAAMRLDPNNLEAPADLALMLCSEGEVAEGLAVFERILQKDPQHHCAAPASRYYRALLAGGGPAYAELEALSRENPGDAEAAEWLTRARRSWLHPRVEPEVQEPFIANIGAAIEHFGEHDPGRERFGARAHGYRLAPPMGEARAAAIETEHGVTLPADYRAFMTRVGAAGAGPFHGLLPLDAPTQLASLGGAFPHLRPLVPDTSKMSPEERATFEGDATVSGTIALSHLGCHYFSLLVIEGPRAGSVWADLRGAGLGVVPTHDTFTQWYGAWVRSLSEGGEVPVPVPPGVCAPQAALSRYLQQWQEKAGLDGSPDVNELREALSSIPDGGIEIGADGSRYFNAGEAVDPCPICARMFDYFFKLGAMRPEQIKPGVPPRCARGCSSATPIPASRQGRPPEVILQR